MDEEHENQEKDTERESGLSFRENDFIPLDDLVYAPLHALAEADGQLRAQAVNMIKGLGRTEQNGAEEMVRLENLNIACEQVRQEGEEGYSVDDLLMQIPLLSIVPTASLHVEKAEIDFSAEVKVEREGTDECAVTARICSPEQRESDFLPRVTYRMQVGVLPAAEGIMRVVDMLSVNQTARKLDTTPVAVDGNPGSDDQKHTWREVSGLKAKIKKLKQLYQKITDMIAEQERMEQISMKACAELGREFDKDKYLMAQANIANRIMEYQEKIMNREIEFGLEKDYK